MDSYFRFSARTVAACYVAFSLLVLLSFATPLWYAWREFVEEDRLQTLQGDSRRLQEVFDEHGIAALQAAIETQVGSQANGNDDILLLTDASRQRLAGNLPSWPQPISLMATTTAMITPVGNHFSLNIAGKTVHIVGIHVVLHGGFHLLVAQDVERYHLLENIFIYGLGSSAAIIIVLGAAGGLAIRRSLLAKVKDLNLAAAAIMQGDFSHRLPHNGSEDELEILVQTENRMLAQIEQLMDGVKNVSNAIAHDLRTPLTELRSRLEELTAMRPGPEQTLLEIEAAIGDVDHVIGIFNALLRLAEIDTGARRSGFVSLQVDRIVDDVVEFYRPLAESLQKNLVFLPTPALPLVGDPLLLAQAVGNLIDNALKYIAAQATVTIHCGRDDAGTVLIAVSDNGPGIAVDEIDKVQERFYRGDASRATPGIGLGLSVVAAVARLHGGKLALSDARPGLCATVLLQAMMKNA